MGYTSIQQVRSGSSRLTRALLAPGRHLLAKLTVAISLLYPFGPIDIIPNRLSYVGHLDDVLVFVVGLLVASRLITPEPVAWDLHSPVHEQGCPAGYSGWVRRLVWSVRSEFLHAAAIVISRPLLRLVLDRWPTSSECRRFRHGLLNCVAPLPPLLRGFAAVAEARSPLTRTMLLSWLLADESYRGPMREGLGSDGTPGDHLQIWNKPPVSLLHLEKTGGTAVTQWLSAHFHPAQIDPDPHRSVPPHVVSPFAHQAPRRLGGYALVHGHYDLPSLRRLGDRRTVVLMLRDPRARLLSMYYFWRSINVSRLVATDESRNVWYAHEYGLLEFLSLDDPFLLNYTDNLYVRRLTGTYVDADGSDLLSSRPAETLDAALTALSSVDVVGLTERMPESIRRIARFLDLPVKELSVANDAIGNLRSRPKEFRSVRREPITPAITAQLDRLTRLDTVIYEAAQRGMALSQAHANHDYR